MSNSQKAIKIILDRYDSDDYKAGIASIASEQQRVYGESDKPHVLAVLSWIERLWPNPPEALQIAAVGHDWERAFENERHRLEDYLSGDGAPLQGTYKPHKAAHSQNSARILARELKGILPPTMLLDVYFLVCNHETGGIVGTDGPLTMLLDSHTRSYNLNLAADILQQADALSFFDILDIFAKWNPTERTLHKIRYTFEKIRDPIIKQEIIDRKYGDKALEEMIKRAIPL